VRTVEREARRKLDAGVLGMLKENVEHGSRIYSLELTEMKTPSPQGSTPFGDTTGDNASDNMIPQDGGDVKTLFSLDDDESTATCSKTLQK